MNNYIKIDQLTTNHPLDNVQIIRTNNITCICACVIGCMGVFNFVSVKTTASSDPKSNHLTCIHRLYTPTCILMRM